MKYLSRVPRPPLNRLVDGLYHLEGTPPYLLGDASGPPDQVVAEIAMRLGP